MTTEQQIAALVEKFIQVAEGHYGIRLPRPSIKFNLTGKTAGTYRGGRYNQLRFNLTALQVEGGRKHLLEHTVPHEVAHLVQYQNPNWPKDRVANKPHGVYWENVMRLFGVPANRCHSLPLPNARRRTIKRFIYSGCGCGREFKLTTQKHNKALVCLAQRGLSMFGCPTCKGKLQFTGKILTAS